MKLIIIRSEKGFSLIESIVVLALVSITVVVYLSAMTTSSKASIKTDEIDTGRALAQSQIEYVKKQPYATTYTPETISATVYPGYSATVNTVNAAQRDAYVQKITISISHNGKDVATLEDCKVRR